MAEEMRGNATCRLLSGSVASAFLKADIFAHLQPPEMPGFDREARLAYIHWDGLSENRRSLDAVLNTLQAHIGKDPGTHLAIAADELRQGVENKDILRINSSAEIIQEIVLKEGLIAISEECGRKA